MANYYIDNDYRRSVNSLDKARLWAKGTLIAWLGDEWDWRYDYDESYNRRYVTISDIRKKPIGYVYLPTNGRDAYWIENRSDSPTAYRIQIDGSLSGQHTIPVRYLRYFPYKRLVNGLI